MNIFNILPFFAVLLTLAACAGPPERDRLEPVNRVSHGVNKVGDSIIIRPVSVFYGSAIPAPVRYAVANSASTLSLPRSAMNAALQGNARLVIDNSTRFSLNMLFGFGGLFNIASDAGISDERANFGQTLGVWGGGEGDYIEMPFIGRPSTFRDAVGFVVDSTYFDSALKFSAKTDNVVKNMKYTNIFHRRYENRGVIDPILYNSADSYEQLKRGYFFIKDHDNKKRDELQILKEKKRGETTADKSDEFAGDEDGLLYDKFFE